MKILVVTHEFPPLNTIGAQRPYSWAKYWSRAGHEIFVITTKKERFDGPIDINFDFRDIKSVNVEEIPYLPLHRINVKKTANLNNQINPTYSIGKPIKFLAKTIRQYLGMGAVLSIRNLWVRPAVKRGIELHTKYEFDFIVSTYGPPASHLVASQLKKKLGIPWLADYRDMWSGTHYQEANGFFEQFQFWQEKRTVCRADVLTTVSEPLRKTLAARFIQTIFKIENGFDQEEVLDLPAPKFSDKVVLAYTGKVRFGKQCVQPLIEALQQLKLQEELLETKLEVLFYGTEFGEIPKLIENYHLQDIVKIKGFIFRKEALKVQRNAHALLFLDWNDVTVKGILTGKIFEYINSGTPILGIGSYENMDTGKVLKETGCGICLGDSVEQLVNIIKKLIHGESIPYWPNDLNIKKYSREDLAMKIIKIMMNHKRMKFFSQEA